MAKKHIDCIVIEYRSRGYDVVVWRKFKSRKYHVPSYLFTRWRIQQIIKAYPHNVGLGTDGIYIKVEPNKES